jgi:uncharacterized membrane protein YecN with MAPEG domain
MFSVKQRGVAAGMAAGVAATALGLLCSPSWFGVAVPSDVAGRLAFAVRADGLIMVWLVAAIANVARGRFFSAADIDGSGFGTASDRIAVDVAVVQNTLEQAVLAAVLYPALACLRAPDEAAMIPALAALFCVGRLCFWVGYRFGAPWRAFGFAATFYPTVFGYFVVIVRLVAR